MIVKDYSKCNDCQKCGDCFSKCEVNDKECLEKCVEVCQYGALTITEK